MVLIFDLVVLVTLIAPFLRRRARTGHTGVSIMYLLVVMCQCIWDNILQ